MRTKKHYRTIFGKVKCIAWVAEAGIGSASQLIAGLYGFTMLGTEIFLVRLVTVYSKNSGKARAHTWVPTCDTISTLSYMVVQGKDAEAVKVFDELRAEKEMLGKAVAGLNTVQQKEKENVNILEMEEK
ncbi:hypothetical protein DFH08DRAFT_795811 [Mycena albidolilacea]|uniref:Uncharacterized protein n=1 Tax=Mycena albidolilacea TaxID=1033008 RepID=A0AAD7ATF8_9AGAR|nr:hypothetical protein DFH08DRAFT_795811 [Mycena albidolilacea]